MDVVTIFFFFSKSVLQMSNAGTYYSTDINSDLPVGVIQESGIKILIGCTLSVATGEHKDENLPFA